MIDYHSIESIHCNLAKLADFERYGLSRSGLYRLAGEGRIRLVKLGGSTLVDCDSMEQFMACLPAASIRVPLQTPQRQI